MSLDLDNPDMHDMHDVLASEYVLGTLSAARRREVELRLPGDASLRAAVHGWQEKLLPLTVLAEPLEPSSSLWSRIEGSLQAVTAASAVSTAPESPATVAPQLKAVPPPPARASATVSPIHSSPRRAAKPPAQTGWWESVRLWRGLAGTGFAAAAVMAAVLVTRQGVLPTGPASPQFMVVLVAPQQTAPGWVIQANSPKELSLMPLGHDVVPVEKSLQFWTKGDNWAGPVSLGLVKPGQTIQIPLDKLPPLQANQLFELTLEPVNGSPINKPTGPIQFIGRAVKVI